MTRIGNIAERAAPRAASALLLCSGELRTLSGTLSGTECTRYQVEWCTVVVFGFLSRASVFPFPPTRGSCPIPPFLTVSLFSFARMTPATPGVVTVDTNAAEDSLAEALAALGVPVTRARLDVGDVLVAASGTLVCVERKTWADLAASICDGRFREQKSRMVEPDTTYCYVIEGGDLPGWDEFYRGMSYKALWGALMTTALRDGVPVFHARTTQDIAALLAYVLGKAQEGGFAAKGGPATLPGVAKRKRDNLAEPAAILRAMLCTIPGMSVAKADALMAQWPTLGELQGADARALAAVTCGSRKLGPKLAAVRAGPGRSECDGGR